MRYRVEIVGETAIIMHNGNSIDPMLPDNLAKKEITSKRGNNRTESDDLRLRELETGTSLWLSPPPDERPIIPAPAMRACIETAARRKREGPLVREGLYIEGDACLQYDKSLGETKAELSRTTQYTVPVVVQRNRILRTRARFEQWGAVFLIDTDPDLVDQRLLEGWLDIAGRRIGLGDWRPEKSGSSGRFKTVSIKGADY